MAESWSRERVMAVARGFQVTCLLAAGAELDLFTALRGKPSSAAALAGKRRLDLRGLTILLDALAALALVKKNSKGVYSVSKKIAGMLAEGGSQSALETVRHQANCLRRWSELAWTVRSGRPAKPRPSILGPAGDRASFIGAMHEISGPMARGVVADLEGVKWTHVLDIGGGSGTWTHALLQLRPGARATIFDLPAVIPMARRRMSELGITRRVTLVPGDFYKDALPPGADLALLSAIIHQNSRSQNLQLYGRISRALEPGGSLVIRDMVMDKTRTKPISGALFAVNMLSATAGGGTFTLDELKEDLTAAGFTDVRLIRRDEGMNSLVSARKKGKSKR